MKEERFEKVLYMIDKTIRNEIIFDRDIEGWYEPIDKDNVYEEQDELYRWSYDIVGRIVELGELQEIEDKKVLKMVMRVPRYLEDKEAIIDFDLWNTIAENTSKYCKVGDVIGVKGRISRINKEFPMTITAEKVSFLKSGNK